MLLGNAPHVNIKRHFACPRVSWSPTADSAGYHNKMLIRESHYHPINFFPPLRRNNMINLNHLCVLKFICVFVFLVNSLRLCQCEARRLYQAPVGFLALVLLPATDRAWAPQWWRQRRPGPYVHWARLCKR